MKATYNTSNYLRKATTILSGLLILAILLPCGANGYEVKRSFQIENVVSFFGTVSPDSTDTDFGAIVIGTKQATSEDLNKLLRPKGRKVLIVTSITAYHITPTSKAPFSIVALLGYRNGSTRGWGNGGLSISRLQTTQVNYRPGLVVTLMTGESLGIRSFKQSNEKARVGIHGYLMDRPKAKK